MFNLERAITDWRRQMLAAGIKTPVPLDELENHLREEIEQQMKSGLKEQEAFKSAVQRMGQADTLKAEFAKIRNAKIANQILNMKNNNRSAIIGLIFLAPAALAVFSGVLRFNAPPILINPVMVMAGLAATLLLNPAAILRMGVEREQGGGVRTFTIQIGLKATNLVVVAAGVLLTAAISGYLFVENFQPR